MKPQITILLLSLAIASCQPRQKPKEEAAGDSRIEYSKDLRPLDYEKQSFKTYALAGKNSTTPDVAKARLNETLAALGTKLYFEADTAKDDESKYISFRRADDPSGVFEMNKVTGRIVFNSGLKEYSADAATEGLPSDKEAIELTKRSLATLKLDLNEKELSKPIVSGLEMSVKKDQEKPQIYKKMVTVRYNRILDGIPVEGATRLIFTYGKKAELTTLIADWGKFEPKDVLQEQVVKADDMHQQIEEVIISEAKEARKIRVVQRDVVLYDDGAGTIEPAVYVKTIMQYTRKSPEGKEESYEVPYDFYRPLIRGTRASFPHVKDQQLRMKPKELKAEPKDSARRNTNDE
ncbi:hypothetical protein GFS24_26755 [Chitinophaga sp. SYP-B3965]|uniref:hypothetical protein n=1 Tax=Chitinophaga sp. SYP-B3965 TaxID=2663120 RepID=UPI001299F795|nr:hypothetical protein [Chitinophaga sp. SYP-B3965]MRG48741.1 hypothetical protein [Chitinophaga sp. SYP-B3965]